MGFLPLIHDNIILEGIIKIIIEGIPHVFLSESRNSRHKAITGVAFLNPDILPLSLSGKALLLIISFLLLFETMQTQPELFGAAVCSVNLADSRLVLKYFGRFANRWRGGCFKHFHLCNRGDIATCVVYFTLNERDKDLELFGISV